MIQINNLLKQYGGKTVLNIPSLNIPKGQSIGLVGNNGAGKTTLFSLLLDLIRADQGAVFLNEIDNKTSETWKSFTSAFIDESFLIGYLTPEEYFYFLGNLRGWNKADVDGFLVNYLEFFNNEILNNKKFIRDLSKGNAKKVGIVGALIGNPELIILDEPFANLDPSTQIKLKKIIKTLAENPEITVLVSSHDLQHTVEVTNRIIVLQKGELVNDILPNEDTLQELEAFFAGGN